MDDTASEELMEALARALGTLQAELTPSLVKRVVPGRSDMADPAGTWRIIDCQLTGGILQPLMLAERHDALWRYLSDALDRQGELRGGILLDDGLALFVPGGSERPDRLAVLSDSTLFDAADELAGDLTLYPSEQRLLKQLVCGFNLTAAAALDGVGHETKRSQFKSLARKLGGGSQAEIAGRALSRIFLEIASVPGEGVSQDDYFDDLLRQFAPEARTLRLRSRTGQSHRFVDIGPIGGWPVVMLHPMILPDFRSADVAVLDTLAIRLIVPLRHGAMSRGTVALDVCAHLDHACEGIELARKHFCGERADIMACISGTAYGLEYARRHRDRVASMAFMGATVKPTTSRSTAGRLRSSLFTLSMSRWHVYSRVMDFYVRRIRRPETLRQLLMGVYRPNLVDLAVIDAEYGPPFGGERLRKFFTSSVQSIKHDFYHQALPDWSGFPVPGCRATFLHGAQDFIHPPAEVRALAQSLGGVPVFMLPNAGQLLYHNHFEAAMNLYRGFLEGRE
ncbi:alpha/beta hydrolase [Sinorhizobium meliloti]|uniref:alpha/beta fold hydrolase n=1 Tax=Rhizobium meliloti TaxID=382 RepID=UPI002D7707FA|nr:alpha/beta hydrolase [Sinorhizobium meliloti]WRQ67353.1 alpha/beta hydrolase [Sinorhizobium meliloti]